MDDEFLAVINLVRVLGFKQEMVLNTMSKSQNGVFNELNARQIKALISIGIREMEGKEPFTLQLLAKYLSMKKVTASLTISSLEQKGLVTRSVDKKDRRCIRIRRTAKGRSLQNAALAGAALQIADMLDELSDMDRKQFVRISKLIYQNYVQSVIGEA